MTSAVAPDGLRLRTRVLDPGAPGSRVALLDLLPSAAQALSWVRDGGGLVGWGRLASVRAEGPDRFAELDRWWRAFVARCDGAGEAGLPGSGPVAFLSVAFADRPGTSVLVVPEVVVGRRDGVTWVTELVGSSHAVAVEPVTGPGRISYAEGRLPITAYRAAVRTAADRMRAGELGKAVLALDLLARGEHPIDPRALLHRLAVRYPSCWTFSVAGLVGATPELLLRRSGDAVGSRVLAGTSWPRDGLDADTLAAQLLASAKDRDEHDYAVRSLAGALRPHCRQLSVPERPGVLRLRNVLHLATDVAGELVRPGSTGPSVLMLAQAAHPTAAVGGTPTAAALRLIGELEGGDRGRYAGPVGWMDSSGDGELGIALRCAQLGVAGDPRLARLFAGCGIVAGSDPDTEVREAAAKLVPIRDALEGGPSESGDAGQGCAHGGPDPGVVLAQAGPVDGHPHHP